MSYLSLILFGCCLAAQPGYSPVHDRPIPKLARGHALEAALDQRISVRWENVNIRSILERLTAEYHIALLRDRRIDPDAIVSFSTAPKPARDIVADVGHLAGGNIRFIGNTAYVGPSLAARNLRTLIALRTEELAAAVDLPQERQQRLSKHQTIHWQDLEQPQSILDNIAGLYGLKVMGGHQIPHDLWGGGTFIAENAAEALSLILIQFDLTFQWRNQATEIEIVPIPDRVVIARGHNPRPHATQKAVGLIQSNLPKLPLRVVDGKIVVQGTIEEHETVERLLHPPRPKIADHPRNESDDPLQNERVTLRVMGVPALALIKDLQKRYNMTFAYNAKQLSAADVDLSQKVDVNVEKTTIDGYLAAFLSPIGAEFERNGLKVTVRPSSDKK